MRRVLCPGEVWASHLGLIDKVPIHDCFGEAQDDGSTPDPSLPAYTDDDNSVRASDSSMSSDLSEKYYDDSSLSNWCTVSSGSTSGSTIVSMNSDDACNHTCCTQCNIKKTLQQKWSYRIRKTSNFAQFSLWITRQQMGVQSFESV